jgi:hypothetical protein
MHSPLNPAVAAKLDDFRSRRRRLIVTRGICAGLFTTASALIGVTVLDWLLFLPQSIRWILSGCVYAGVAWVVWSTCLRLIWRIPSAAEMARWVESTEPSLREDLLAAVELGSPESERPWHSIAFRRFLQDDVAHKMNDVDVGALLPWALIHRWVHVALVATILLLILFCIPGLRFGQRVTRALLPMASVQRVSLTKIEILSPRPADTAVAQGDEIDVLVRIGGPTADGEVTLETATDGGPSIRVSMSPVPGGQRSYWSTVRVGQDAVRYRIRAGDARTAEHRLLSRRRPQVTSFQKTYRYPEYLSLPTRTDTDSSGDVSAVEGTEADLIVSISQPVSLAQLVIVSPSGKRTLQMTPVAGDQQRSGQQVGATVPIDSSGTYRIELVGSESGLANTFSPEYVIHAFPDQPPSISINEPASAILVPADEIVLLSATAEDDHGLSRIEQQVRFGENDWSQGILIETLAGDSTVQVSRVWDIYPLDLRPGDVVSTRLVAVDKRGGRGESQAIRAVISSQRFDPKRWSGIADARSAHDELEKLVAAANALHEATSAASDPATAQAALTATDQYELQAGVVMSAIETAMRSAEEGRPSIDLLLVGQAVAQASTVGLRFLRQHLAIGDYPNAIKTSAFVRSRISLAAGSFDHLLRMSETSAITNDLMSLRRMHREAVERANRGNGPNRIVGRARAIGSEAGLMADRVAAMRTHAEPQELVVLKQVHQDLLEVKTLSTSEDVPLTLESVQTLGELLETSLANTMSLFQEGLLKSVAPRKRLGEVAGNTDEPILRAARLSRQAGKPNAADDQLAVVHTKELSEAALDAATAALMTTAALERKRSDSDAGFVADSARAWRAIQAIRLRLSDDRDEASQACDDLDRLADAVRVVNCVRHADDLIALVGGIFARDQRLRSELVTPENAIDAMFNPSGWFCAESLYSSLSSRLPDAAVSPAAAKIIDNSRRSQPYLAVRKEMVARPAVQRPVVTKGTELGVLLSDLKRARELMRDDLQEARQTIAQLSPPLQTLLAELARDVQAGVRDLQDALDANAADENQPDSDDERHDEAIENAIDEQQEQADAIAQRLEQLRETLRDDAAEQNIEEERGRERIRDDDDALAVLDELSGQADRAVEQAAAAQDPQQQRDTLTEVARRQAELADQLNQLAQHFENLRRDNAAPSRSQLREAEARMGLDEEFDARQRQLERLADIAAMQPIDAIEALERELDQNQWMQRELEELTRQQLEDLQRQWEEAAGHPSDVSEVAEMLRATRQTLDRAARNQQRLGHRDEAERLRQIAESLEQARDSIDQDARRDANVQSNEPSESVASGDPEASTSAGEASEPGDRRTADSAEEIQAAIDEAAQQLERLLEGEAMVASPDEIPTDSQPRTPPSAEAGSPPPPADLSKMSRAVARQLAEAMQQLDASPDNRPGGAEPQASGTTPTPETPSSTSPEQAHDSGSEPGLADPPPSEPNAAESEGGEQGAGQQGSGQQGSGQTGSGATSYQAGSPAAASPDAANRVAEAMAGALRAGARHASAQRASGLGQRSDQGQSSAPDRQGYAAMGSGAKLVEDSRLSAPLPPIDQMTKEDWAKLPPQIARDLLDGRREKVSPEYRRAIETYFRLIAETAVEETEDER